MLPDSLLSNCVGLPTIVSQTVSVKSYVEATFGTASLHYQ